MSIDTKNFPETVSKTIGFAAKTAHAGLSPQSSESSPRKIAEEFSSMLMLEMLKSMRATLSSEGLDGESAGARENYSTLADIAVTRSLAKNDGMGLTAFLERSLSRVVASTTVLKETLGSTDEHS